MKFQWMIYLFLDVAAVLEVLWGLSSCLVCYRLAGVFSASSFSADLTSLVRICGPRVINSHVPGGPDERWVLQSCSWGWTNQHCQPTDDPI